MSMELSDRIKRPKARAGSPTASTDQVAQPGEPKPDTVSASGGGTFDHWLDDQLQALYRTVLNEPLPLEILDLLSRPKRETEG
jgi:hypothetical protein